MSVAFDDAIPTKSHMAIKKLIDTSKCKDSCLQIILKDSDQLECLKKCIKLQRKSHGI